MWTHDGLANDLAGSLSNEGRMVWLDMQLGPQGSPRPDVYRIDKSFARPMPTAYECKISRSDFLADVTVGKWKSYLAYAYCVIFAVPKGLIAKSEVPDMCGLIERGETSWRLAKRPTVNPHPIDQQCLLKLLIDGVRREGPCFRRNAYRNLYAGESFAKKFGHEAARYIADAASTHHRIEQAEQQADLIRERAERDAKNIRERCEKASPGLWQQLVTVLDLPAATSDFKVRDAIHLLKNRTEGGRYKTELSQMVIALDRLTCSAKRQLTAEDAGEAGEHE